MAIYSLSVTKIKNELTHDSSVYYFRFCFYLTFREEKNTIVVKQESSTINDVMCPKLFAGYTFIRNAQIREFKSRRCIRTESVEEIFNQNRHKTNIA